MSHVEKFFIDYNSFMLCGVLVFTVLLMTFLYIVFRKIEEYERFKSFEFYNVVWKWNWMSKKRVVSLWCYCPQCGSELTCDDESCRSSNVLANKITYFICQKCGDVEKSRITGGDRKYIIKIVKFEIIKKVNENSYKDEAINKNG
ncbi:MAG: hypothetical protein LBI78_06020 [Campylobacteraceae bacterium]|jgi:predicted RNA-binding Zn-ribbon protein involved in translation (DUF1610 family)|nr:hypothetical protein [Campylobacteraceae bacterium]